MQSLYDGRNACSFVPQSNDPLLVVSGKFCEHTVHVTSYLNFSAEIHGLPSWNSVNVRKFSAECPHPLCKLTAGTCQLRNTFLRIRLSRVGGESVFTLTTDSSGSKRVWHEVENMAALYVDTKAILSSRFGVPRGSLICGTGANSRTRKTEHGITETHNSS